MAELGVDDPADEGSPAHKAQQQRQQQQTAPAPPPIDSWLEGSPDFTEQNPVAAGLTYTYGSQQTLVNQRQTYADGSVSDDYVTGVIMNVAISVVDESGRVLTSADNISIQEIISVESGNDRVVQNERSAPADSNGIIPDTIGPARTSKSPQPGAGEALNQFLSSPRRLEVIQELYVTAPNRGVVLYGRNRITMSNVDSSGRVGPVRITHTPLSVTPTVVTAGR
jgi:hypothetical protein